MKECPNCKAVGKKKYLQYQTESVKDKGGGHHGRAVYVCRYCGFKTKV